MEASEVKCDMISHVTNKYETKPKYSDHKWTSVNVPDLPPFQLSPPTRKDGCFYYGLRIVTGDQKDADAHDIAVYVKLDGINHTSGDINIGREDGFWTIFKEYFGTSTYDDIIIEATSKLDVDVFTVGLKFRNLSFGAAKNNWYVDFTQVYDLQPDGRPPTTFPFYHWIGQGTSEVSCTSKNAILKSIENNLAIVRQRSDQLEKRKEVYKWKKYPAVGYPSSIDDTDADGLPLDEEFERTKDEHFTGSITRNQFLGTLTGVKVFLVQAFEKLTGLAITEDKSMTSLDKYEEFTLRIKSANKDVKTVNSGFAVYEGYRWVSDVEFGRQILNGINPVIIKKCTSIPDHFLVNEEFFDTMNKIIGATLTDEMEAGRVYICDFSEIMNGLKCKDGCYCPAPTCLLHVNKAGQLLPIAIKLQPGEGNPIFFPTDHWMDWLTAKIYFKSAEGQHHQLSSHFVSCHATMETYNISIKRNLPDSHPLSRLLLPHTRYTAAINAAARKSLIGEGGLIDSIFSIGGEGKVELVKRINSKYSVRLTHIKENLEKRGVNDAELLPGYYYRDDGLKLWEVIESYVRRIVDVFYKEDEDVEGDDELKCWVTDLHDNGFPAYRDASVGRDFPEKIEKKDVLIDTCTLIIFTGSVQHAAVNFGQFEIFGYVPNTPLSLHEPPPTEKGKTDYAFLLRALPKSDVTALSGTVAASLVSYSPDEIFLGGFPQHWYAEKEAIDAENKFLSDLRELDEKFTKRNESLDVPYKYMMPSRVPNSITI